MARIRSGAQLAIAAALLGLLAMPGVQAAPSSSALPEAPALDALLEPFTGDAPEQDGRVDLDAWVEGGANDRRELVVVVTPAGKAKLIADPGITITPVERPGLAWVVTLPHRHIDTDVEYFTPPATVRVPFAANDDLPIDLQVEYAWCVLDFQCFFGEATLRVDNRIE